ncbi:MAG: single-stranded DNA-binding protein [Candidatus Obscuribacterales bacterium]|nr:single-stranded DNA-binding protein [Candidatus Obscuribacterales bacterium]
MSMITVSLVGNLVRATEQMTYASGRTKTVFTVAVNNPPKKQGEKGEADFYRVEAWGPLGDLAHKYLEKGDQVGVSGRLAMEKWQDREGRERMTPTINAVQISLPRRSNNQQQSEQEQEQEDDAFSAFNS